MLKVLGMDKRGEIYAAQMDVDGNLLNESCDVIRPVSKKTLKYLREDEESVEDLWKCAVASGNTRLGLSEYFQSTLDEMYDDDGEGFPSKDDSFVDDIIGAGEGQVTRERADADAERCTGDEVGTWEASGWFPPTKRFAVEYADKATLKAYYEKIGI